MRPHTVFSLLFLLLVNLCIGQEGKPGHSKSKAVADKAKASIAVTKGVVPAVDSVRVLKDSIHGLHDSIMTLKKEVEELEDGNKQLISQVTRLKLALAAENRPSKWEERIRKGIVLAIIGAVIVLVLGAWYLFVSRKKGTTPPMKENTGGTPMGSTMPSRPVMPTGAPAVARNIPARQDPSERSFSHVHAELERNRWFVVGASSIGKTHVSTGKPCQDNHFCADIKDGWGIAVVSDGAGSAAHSHLGSAFVTKKAFELFREMLQHKYIDRNRLPGNAEWKDLANHAFRRIYEGLTHLATSEHVEFHSVACTIIVLVFTPEGLLSAHIGDGRAGYCNESGKWQALITPHKGEEANQTIFMTTPAWQNGGDLFMSGVPVPETRVISEKTIAFTLLTDGCESHSFESSKMNDQLNKWSDPNLPADKFFNPLVEQLRKMNENKMTLVDANDKWIKFVESGTEGLRDEPDDKTLILGIRI